MSFWSGPNLWRARTVTAALTRLLLNRAVNFINSDEFEKGLAASRGVHVGDGQHAAGPRSIGETEGALSKEEIPTFETDGFIGVEPQPAGEAAARACLAIDVAAE